MGVFVCVVAIASVVHRMVEASCILQLITSSPSSLPLSFSPFFLLAFGLLSWGQVEFGS